MTTLGDGKNITTVGDKEIVLTASDGQIFKMRVADLAEAVRSVMPVATDTNKGLMSNLDLVKLSTISFVAGVSGGELDKWYQIGSFETGEFRPIRMLLDYGPWNLSNRSKLDITIVANLDGAISAGSINPQQIGYVISGNRLDVFFKITAGRSLIGTVIGGITVARGLYFAAEPNGIVYL